MYTIIVNILGFLYLVSADTPPALREYIHAPGKFMAPIPHHSMLIQTNTTLEMCAAKCTIYFRTKQFPCYAFEYTTGSRMCIFTNMTTLMKENGFLSLKENSNGVDYYERSKASFKNLFRVIPHAAIKQMESYYLIRQNTTLEECARFCHISHTQTCMSFSYAKGSGVCGLCNKFWVNGDKNGVSLQSTNIYDHYQYYTAWPCNATLPPDYNPHAIASPKFPYLSVTNIDCHVTIEAHEGERISITIPTFFAGENICQDGDDGLTIYDGPDESANILRHLCEKNFRQMVILNSTTNFMYIRYKTKSKAIAFKALYDYISVPGGSNSCLNNHCVNGATCVNDSSSSYTCACVPGFTGRFCESNIDDCSSNRCYFGGSCIDEVNDFHCNCPKLFGGKRCEKYLGRCADNPCQHGDCQVRGKNDYVCHCDSGYTGKNCSIPIPSCLSSPCVQGRCVDLRQGGFVCQCPPNYNGTRCENLISDPCVHQPCANGKCVAKGTQFLCQCNQGFTGTLCNTVIDHCLNANCYHGTCINGVGGYRCFCNSNYTGSNCNIKLNACVDANCGHGICQLVGSGFMCVCETGFTGERCDMAVRDYCKAAPCVHGNCTNKVYGYSCTCDAGYLGTNCDTTQNYCQGQDCGYGICENSQLGYRCLCAQGYEGIHCDKHVLSTTQPPVCNSQPCQNGGTCLSDGSQSFTCHCAPPFSGTFCQNDNTPCLSYPCHGNSTCAPLGKSFVCTCPPGMTGDRCDVSFACSSNPCKLGMCLEKHGSFECQLLPLVGHSNTTSSIQIETTTTTPPVPQRSDISCNADTIDTFVPISMLPSGAPLTWRDPSCKVTSNGTHMISSIGHNQCGTTVTITKDTVEFENELTAQISNHSANTLIDFGENSYVIPVKCIYPRTETPMTSYVPLQQHVRFYEKRYGHFDVDITQYDSDKFSSAIQSLGVPRKVALNTEIFVEVKMNDQFNNGLGIHVDKCIATPSPSPSDSTYYNLLTDGCPASQHVQLYNAPANKVRFGVRAFQFTTHNSSIVYIHCQTSMCEVGTPYCVSNCVTAGRRKRDVAPDQKSHLVSTGPFVFVADEQDNPIRMSTIVASVSLFVAVVACVAAVMGWTRKKTHTSTKEEGLL